VEVKIQQQQCVPLPLNEHAVVEVSLLPQPVFLQVHLTEDVTEPLFPGDQQLLHDGSSAVVYLLPV